MKPGSYLINNSRGTVVDLDALAKALRDGHLAGAALDVFPVEPSSNADRFKTPLQGLKNVILTPHIGGSTEQAQDRIGREVARKMLDYFSSGSTMGAVNFPQVQLQARTTGARFSHVHRNVPGMLRRLNEIFVQRDINIIAQYLETDREVGYVVLDADLAGHDSHGIARRHPRAGRHDPGADGVRELVGFRHAGSSRPSTSFLTQSVRRGCPAQGRA